MTYQSNALWPDGVCSTDTHDTVTEAFGAIRALERDGFGGDGSKLPLLVWVSEVQQPPQLPVEYLPDDRFIR